MATRALLNVFLMWFLATVVIVIVVEVEVEVAVRLFNVVIFSPRFTHYLILTTQVLFC